ncbi:MAG: hypothetical protein ACXWLH_02460 [Candidatus Saccharimonadales bacterium]
MSEEFPSLPQETKLPEPTVAIEGQPNAPEFAQLTKEELGMLFHEEERQPSINPSALDRLSPGNYRVFSADVHGPTYYDDTPHGYREIQIKETPAGRVVNLSAFKLSEAADTTYSSGNLLRSLGYEVDEDGNITGIPTPATVTNAAASLDVEVMPVNAANYGEIDPFTYINAFAEGKYPISVNSEELYVHDIHDDHITTLVLGGEPLKTVLKSMAKRASEMINNAPDENIRRSIAEKSADVIDTVTNSLGGNVYSRPAATTSLSGMLEKAEYLGINETEINNIIEIIKENAQKFGIKIGRETWQPKKILM